MRLMPKWEREEILLVLELGHRRGWPKSMSVTDPEVIELSQILRDRRNPPLGDDYSRVRNANGVVRKYGDLQCLHPRSTSKETNGGTMTRTIMSEYLETPTAVLVEASLTRRSIHQLKEKRD